MKSPVPVTLYVDVFPGMDLSYAIGHARPHGAPPPGVVRYRVHFMVEDPNAPGAEIPPGHVTVEEVPRG